MIAGDGPACGLDRPAAGMATGTHAILIPEQKTSMEQIAEWVVSARDRGRAPLVVVAEGFVPDYMESPHSERGLDTFGRPRLGGVAEMLAPEIEARTGIETRATVLGHIQRGGVPSAFDRSWPPAWAWPPSTRWSTSRWGTMVSLNGTDIDHVGFEAPLATSRTSRRTATTRPRSSSAKRPPRPWRLSI